MTFEEILAVWVAAHLQVDRGRVTEASVYVYEGSPGYSELTPGEPWQIEVSYKLDGDSQPDIELYESDAGSFVAEIAEIAKAGRSQ